MVKGFIVYTVEVYQLSPTKVEEFCDRLLERLKLSVPNGWKVIVMPVRNQGSRTQVFTIGESGAEEVLPFVLENDKLSRVERKEETRSSIRDFVMLMLGAPVQVIGDNLKGVIEDKIEESYRFGVNDKQTFVYEQVRDLIDLNNVKDGIIEIYYDEEEES